MNLRSAKDDQIHLSAEIDWEMLDKSKFFVLGAALFSAVSTTLYPMIVLKTRQQVSLSKTPCAKLAYSIITREGPRGLYRGLGTSLVGTVPARALYMGALEVTKSNIANATSALGFPAATAMTVANGVGGLSAAVAAQIVWTPIDVVTQRLMVQGGPGSGPPRYINGVDAFRKILFSEGVRGLYRGFGMSILTYAPSNAVWWSSYSLAQRAIQGHFGHFGETTGSIAVQGISAAMASGLSAVVTMPIDTVKTRFQVLGGERNGVRDTPTVLRVVRELVREGGFGACYRGLGPRWASMTFSATAMVTTYEFLKRLSAKDQARFAY